MADSSLLSDLIDLHTALAADEATDFDHKRQRDRRIGQALQPHRKRPVRQLRDWLDRVDIPGWQRQGPEGTQIYHALGAVLVLAGLITGWGLAQAVLHYTGKAPINVVNALGLLVLPQILLLLLWLLTALPRRLPLLRSLQSALRFLHPGRLAGALTRLFPSSRRSGLEALWNSEHAIVLGPAARWLFSLWSQLFAFWFNVGLLLAVVYLITFSDLAFAWSTTLALDDAAFQRLVNALSWPWHGVFPEGRPTAQLIEISRYYRLEEGTLAGDALAAEIAPALGGWWPFLIAAIVCYGLLPRLVTLLVSWLRFRHHLAAALPRLPGSAELLARMNSPLVTTAARQPEAAPQPATDLNPQPRPPAHRAMKCHVVDWAGTVGGIDPVLSPLRAMGLKPLDFLTAGGARSTDEDAATIAALCRKGAEGIAVIVKAWEPPLLEFLDFIQGIRTQCDHRRPILVLLWGGPESVQETDRETWQLTLGQLKDPELHIAVLEPVG